MIFCVRGEWLSSLAALLCDGRILAAGENLKGIEKLYFPVLKTVVEKLGGAARLVLYFNEETVLEIKVAALAEIHGVAEDCLEPLWMEAKCEDLAENLMLIDSRMPELLKAMQAEYERTGENDTKVLLQMVAEKNPLAFPCPDFYSYKWKQYLLAAFGAACGGYVNVSRDGERLDFHIYDREHLEDFLVRHTFLRRDGRICLVE